MKQLLSILLLFCSLILQAQNVYVADSSRQWHSLKNFTSVLADSQEKFTEKDILAGRADHLFQPHAAMKNKAPRQYWLRFAVKTASPFQHWVLLLRDSAALGASSIHDEADVYYSRNGQLLNHQRTGVNIPRSGKLKGYPAGFNAVDFTATAGADMVVYVHVSNLFEGSPSFSYPVIQDPALPAEKKVYSVLLPVLSTIAGIFCLIIFGK